MQGRELYSLWKSVPFHPFTIHMADGRSFAVVRRDLIMVSPNYNPPMDGVHNGASEQQPASRLHFIG